MKKKKQKRPAPPFFARYPMMVCYHIKMAKNGAFNTFNLINVSTTFGNVLLSGFRVSGNGTGSGVDIRTVSFTPIVTPPLPEPTTLSLFVFGGLMGLVSRFRHRSGIAA